MLSAARMLLTQIEQDEFLREFQSYTNRIRSPYEQSYSQDPLYYSNNVGRTSMPTPRS